MNNGNTGTSSGVSKFTNLLGAVVSTFLTIGLVSTLLKLATTDTGPTPDQKTALMAQEEQRKADMAKQDALREESILEEQRRRAYSPGMSA